MGATVLIPVFSSSVFGVFGRLMMSIKWLSTTEMYGIRSSPAAKKQREGILPHFHAGKKSSNRGRPRTHLDHLADAAERRVLLLVVANVAQRRAPAMTSTQQPVRLSRPSVDCCTDMTHHCRMKRCSMGATCAGHTKPKRPMVIAAK